MNDSKTNRGGSPKKQARTLNRCDESRSMDGVGPIKIQQSLRALNWSPAKILASFDGHMHGCWLLQNDQQGRFVMKFADRRKDRAFLSHEENALRFLTGSKYVAVPKILAYLEDAELEGVLALEHIDAPNGDQWLKGQSPRKQAEFYKAMGRSLRSLHQVPIDLCPFLEAEDPNSVIERGLKLAAPFLRNVKEINSLLVEELARHPLANPCFLHRDFRERNVLAQIQDNQLKLTILDFEWASLGDPYLDLAGSRIPFSKFSEPFLSGYSNDRGLNSEQWRKLRFYATLDLLDVFRRQDELTVDISGLIYQLTKKLKKHVAALRDHPLD